MIPSQPTVKPTSPYGNFQVRGDLPALGHLQRPGGPLLRRLCPARHPGPSGPRGLRQPGPADVLPQRRRHLPGHEALQLLQVENRRPVPQHPAARCRGTSLSPTISLQGVAVWLSGRDNNRRGIPMCVYYRSQGEKKRDGLRRSTEMNWCAGRV